RIFHQDEMGLRVQLRPPGLTALPPDLALLPALLRSGSSLRAPGSALLHYEIPPPALVKVFYEQGPRPSGALQRKEQRIPGKDQPAAVQEEGLHRVVFMGCIGRM